MIPGAGVFAVFKGLAAIKSLLIFGGIATILLTGMFSCNKHFRTIEENTANKIQNQLLVEANTNAVKRMEQAQSYAAQDKRMSLRYKGEADALRASQAEYERRLAKTERLEELAPCSEVVEECLLEWGALAPEGEKDET